MGLGCVSCTHDNDKVQDKGIQINVIDGTIVGLPFYTYTPGQVKRLLGPPQSIQPEDSRSRDERAIGGGLRTSFFPLKYDYPQFGLSFFFTHSRFDSKQRLENLLVVLVPHKPLWETFQPFRGELIPQLDSTTTRDFLLGNIKGTSMERRKRWPQDHDPNIPRMLDIPSYPERGGVFLEKPAWIKSADYTEYTLSNAEEKGGRIVFGINPSLTRLERLNLEALPLGITTVKWD